MSVSKRRRYRNRGKRKENVFKLEKRLKVLNELVKSQCPDRTEYMVGISNGMSFANAIMMDIKPKYFGVEVKVEGKKEKGFLNRVFQKIAKIFRRGQK